MSQAKKIMKQARLEVRSLYGAEDDGSPVDILISCDRTWQRCGFSSYFGAVFVITHETGKVLDYAVKSKFCKAYKHWEAKDHTTEEYKEWKESHAPDCSVNFLGSAGSMKPKETLDMFQLSLSHGLCYKWLISDGDSDTCSPVTRPTIRERPPLVEKVDCVGHVQKNGNSLTQPEGAVKEQRKSFFSVSLL